MKPISRRKFLAVTGAVTSTAALPQPSVGAGGGVNPKEFDDADAMLYDATRCIGCRACARRCRQYHSHPPDPAEVNGVAFDMPTELSPNNTMVIQAYRQEANAETGEPGQWSFMNKHCMHCNVPACVTVCPVAAMRKTDRGPVVYDESRCIGCRYCLLACPYQVPRYEWVDRTPRVRKCNLARVCVDACPVGALKKGIRRELIEEAHRRIHDHAGRYVDHVYGEHEAGGASYLILSGIPLEKFGFPKLPSSVRSSYSDALMSAVPGWIIGLGLFLGGLYRMERRQRRTESGQETLERSGEP